MFKKKFKWLVIFGCFILVGMGVSLTTAEIFHKTGNAEFCGNCHLMKPMVDTWKKSVHGGNNDKGIVAECADCHLEHSSAFAYTKGKVVSGTKDVMMNFISPPDTDFFIKNLDDYPKYVAMSGCQACHKNIVDNDKMSHKANRMHKRFFADLADGEKGNCIDCHQDGRNATPLSAHPGLEDVLQELKEQKASAKTSTEVKAK